MIWALTREQLRSQRRYALATGVLIAVTIALATYGALMALTAANTARTVDHLLGSDRDSGAWVYTDADHPFEDLAPHINAANVEGDDVVAVAEVPAILAPDNNFVYPTLVSLYGDVDWAPILVKGSPPSTGQIAVSAEWARINGVGIGDTVTLITGPSSWAGGGQPLDITLTISGITRSTVMSAAVSVLVPNGYVAWDDVPSIDGSWVEAYNSAQNDHQTPGVAITISGNGAWPWSDELASVTGDMGVNSALQGSAPVIAVIVGIGVAILVIGLIAMAVAIGRSQAQVRTKWVGTARTLGATRRQVVWATILETAAVAIVAGAAGYALGAALAVVHLRSTAASVEQAMLVMLPGAFVWVFVGAIALALVLSLIVGAIPAFWSARMSPAAALKPTVDVTDGAQARRVPVKSLAIAWCVSFAITFAGWRFGAGGSLWILVVAAVIVLAVSGILLAHEALGHSLRWHARRLSRARRRAAVVAGDAILARPRQASIPALIAALATGVLTGLLIPLQAQWANETPERGATAGGVSLTRNPYNSPLVILGVYAVVTFLCVIIAAAASVSTAREAATRQALGLTRIQGRLAAAIQYVVAQAHGIALGLLGAFAITAFAIPQVIHHPLSHLGSWASDVALLLGVVLVIAAACVALGALIVGALTPATVPLARLEVGA